MLGCRTLDRGSLLPLYTVLPRRIYHISRARTGQPDGDGCSALRKGSASLPDFAALACAFCSRWAGKTILFVGDSTQMQFFDSFSNILGGVTSSGPPLRARASNPGHACRERAERGRFGGYDADVETTLCEAGERGVRARFIRNELLWLDKARNNAAGQRAKQDEADSNGIKQQQRGQMLCEWDVAARDEADMIVLNRGYHSIATDLGVVKFELNETMSQLSALVRQRRTKPAPPLLIYRGTHASLHRCSEYPDPLTRSSSGGSHPVTHALRLHRSNANAWYYWRAVYAHHRLDQDLMRHLGVAYINTFVATSLRPGGRLHPDDCNHFCLPGPVDEWTRLLLAFAT